MRDLFPDFYEPPEEDLAKAWAEGVFVLDANVLLQMFEVSPSVRDDFLRLLGLLENRVFVPHHAALEYQRRRRSVARKKCDAVVGAIKGMLNAANLEKVVENFPARFPELEKLVKRLKTIGPDLEKATGKEAEATRARLEELLVGRVGAAIRKEQLEALNQAAEKRYKAKQPPGYMDAKAKGPEAVARWNGMVFPLANGDFYLWHQILEMAKERKKPVILVQQDGKDDWWSEGHPRRELAEEMRLEAGVMFWQYTSENLMTLAVDRLEGYRAKPESASRLRSMVWVASPDPTGKDFADLRNNLRRTLMSKYRHKLLDQADVQIEIDDEDPDGDLDLWLKHLASEGRDE